MKYLLSIALILITSVTLSYYLLNNPNFLPVNNFGEYNLINIVTLVFLLSIMLFTLTNLLIYLIQVFLNKYGKKKGSTESTDKRLEQEEKEEVGGKDGGKENIYEERLKREIIILSLKISTLITVGIIVVFTLNYLHILNWIWGLLILLVVLIFTFII